MHVLLQRSLERFWRVHLDQLSWRVGKLLLDLCKLWLAAAERKRFSHQPQHAGKTTEEVIERHAAEAER